MEKLTVENLKNRFPDVYDFITIQNLLELKEQRYELGNGNYVNIESYTTCRFKERRYESHRKCLDIQYIIKGEENIMVCNIAKLKVERDYDCVKDITFYSNDFVGKRCHMKEGDMLLLTTQDAHMPCVSVDKPNMVKKAVFKIMIG